MNRKISYMEGPQKWSNISVAFLYLFLIQDEWKNNKMHPVITPKFFESLLVNKKSN